MIIGDSEQEMSMYTAKASMNHRCPVSILPGAEGERTGTGGSGFTEIGPQFYLLWGIWKKKVNVLQSTSTI